MLARVLCRKIKKKGPTRVYPSLPGGLFDKYIISWWGVKNVCRLDIMWRMKKGRIIPNGVILEKHEYKTILLFTEMGVDIELIPKSERRGIHTPDVMMGGLKWEIKSPKGDGKYLMQNTIQRAVKQRYNKSIEGESCIGYMRDVAFFLCHNRIRASKILNIQV